MKTYEPKNLMILSTVPDERLEIVLEECRTLGYRSIFCGETEYPKSEVPANRCYVLDWKDTEALLEIAEKEQVDGVVGLCDKAMVPTAELTQRLELPGNSPESMELLLSKNDFRTLQEKAGAFCPGHVITDTAEEAIEKSRNLHVPLIVKPLLSSSSFGMSVLKEREGLAEAFEKASGYSRNGQVCVEEFITNHSLRIIEIDLFLLENEILWDGIRYCYRIERAPLRPVYDVYPAELSDNQMKELRTSVEAVIRTAGARLGEYNVEGFFTEAGNFFIVEINPRQAGHYNPQDIQLYCGVNLTRLLITTACGDLSYFEELKNLERTRRHILSYSVFSFHPGIFERIHIDESLLPKQRRFHYLHGQKPGDHVRDILHATRPIAKVVFEFDSVEELEEARAHIEDLVYPVLKED